jgi:hypothetical protein
MQTGLGRVNWRGGFSPLLSKQDELNDIFTTII